jgi:hypothetical protein
MGKIQRAKITILDLSPAGSIGKCLGGVLTGGCHENEQFCFEVRLIHVPHANEGHLEKVFDDGPADVVVVVLHGQPQCRSVNLFNFLKRTLGVNTVIAVSATQEPKDFFDLLRQGADEFISLPIERRLWRLLEHSSQKMITQQEMRGQRYVIPCLCAPVLAQLKFVIY